MKVLIALAALIVAINALSDNSQWLQFKENHSKTYNIVEDILRFQAFQQNLRRIEEHNAKYEKGEETFFLTTTKFADWTDDEFKAMLKTQASRKPEIKYSKKFEVDPTYTRPESVDWRDTAVLDIKDQGDCGSCWAFSSTGALEGQLLLKKNQRIAFSEQELVDCVTANFGCDGGYMDDAFEYVQKNGLSSEEQYPYKATDNSCKKVQNKALSTISGYVDVSESEDALADAVSTVGPIAVGVDANWYWQLYGGGIFNQECGDDINHAVLAVGYESDYWLIKNSWGKKWGEEGYIKLVRGKNICRINELASYPEL